jgi:hypothetical protein
MQIVWAGQASRWTLYWKKGLLRETEKHAGESVTWYVTINKKVIITATYHFAFMKNDINN